MKTLCPIIPMDSPLRRTLRTERPRRLAPVLVVLAGHLLLLAVLAIKGVPRGGGTAWAAGPLFRGGVALNLAPDGKAALAEPGHNELAAVAVQGSELCGGLPEIGFDLKVSGDSETGLPFSEQVAELAETRPPTVESTEPTGATLYSVKRGDTLSRIAKTHGTSVRALQAANGLASDLLVIGQKLQLPD